MAPRRKSSFWRKCRILFRHFRIGLWLAILAVIGALVYLDQVGLPDFVKRPVLQKLRDRGLDVQFTRLRWRWHRGFVAEDVRFGQTDRPSGPRFSAREAQVRLDYRALMKLQLQVSGLVIRKGDFSWLIPETNGPPRELAVKDIQTELQLLPGDLWELDNFQAQFAGARIQLSGSISNASAVRNWTVFHARQPARPGALEDQLRRWVDAIDRMHFSSPPELRVDLRGDARQPQDFSFWLTATAPDADTPWGIVQSGVLSVLLHRPTRAALSRGEINLNAASAQSRWGLATNVALRLRLFSPGPGTNLVRADLDLTASTVETQWAAATNFYATARWLHSITNPIPLSGRGELQADDIRSRWGGARQLRLAASLLAPANPAVRGDESWGWWANLAPYALSWEGQLRDVTSPQLETGELFCAADWDAPMLTFTRISSSLYGGQLDARAAVNAASREFTFATSTDFDLQKTLPLLTEKGREWLSQFSWSKPPVVKADGGMILPPWSGLAHADWRGEVRPTIHMDGQFTLGEGAYRGVTFTAGASHFSYSNLCWRLPDLVATRPEGELKLVHEANDLTHAFYFGVHSSIDVRALRPLLPPESQRALDLVEFTVPPAIDGEVRGQWHEFDRIGLNGRVSLTNFAFRGESATDLTTGFEYTNRFLTLVEPRVHRGTQEISATLVCADFPAGKVYVTNGFSTAEPDVIARAIGPEIARTIEPYHFRRPPTARVNGIIPLHEEKEADLHFELAGGPFEWWKFLVPRITGRVDWMGEHVALRDVYVNFYLGNAAGNADFNFTRGKNADFRFDVIATNTDFHSLMADLAERTNRLEGLLGARLTITDGNVADWRTWQGNGNVNLRDGLIWEIPVFGALSPVLDGISPGLGSSQARDGSATFVITNGVVRSDDLEIRASKMRLRYWGTVDLQGRIDARTEAELFRDTVAVGWVLSRFLWPVSKVFQYRITGTVQNPKIEPSWFVPRIILMPLHPFQTLKEMATESPEPFSTNAPPVAPKY